MLPVPYIVRPGTTTEPSSCSGQTTLEMCGWQRSREPAHFRLTSVLRLSCSHRLFLRQLHLLWRNPAQLSEPCSLQHAPFCFALPPSAECPEKSCQEQALESGPSTQHSHCFLTENKASEDQQGASNISI